MYPPVIVASRLAFRALGLRFTIEGSQNIPRSGPAVIACNHVSYLDFTFCGYAARPFVSCAKFCRISASTTSCRLYDM